jgi:hypothetical protein
MACCQSVSTDFGLMCSVLHQKYCTHTALTTPYTHVDISQQATVVDSDAVPLQAGSLHHNKLSIALFENVFVSRDQFHLNLVYFR